MKRPAKQFVLCTLGLVGLAIFRGEAKANDVYLAQTSTGGNTGADCADALVYSYFNAAGNWQAAPGAGIKIGYGTTVHLCGTFTAGAGASAYLWFQGSGTPGMPVTLRFEPGAILTAPYWGSNGAIYSSYNYNVVDGVCTSTNVSGRCSATQGTIEATANGTVLVNHVSNTAGLLFSGGSNNEIRNLTVSDIYVHTADSTDNADGTAARGIFYRSGSSISIHDNIVNNAGNAIRYSYAGGATSSGVNIYNNSVSNINWGIIIGDGNANAILNGPVNVYNNDISNFMVWDANGGGNHHDGVYCFSTNPSSALNACTIYNNYLHGDPGIYTNAWIYVSQLIGGDTCGGLYIFNNVVNNTALGTTGTPANGFVQDWCTNDFIYNNTFIGLTQASTNPLNGSNPGININLGAGFTMENNIVSTVRNCINMASGTSLAVSDYNIYNACAVGWDNLNTAYSAFQAWQGCHINGCPQGAHDTNSSTAAANLNGSTFVPNIGSPAINTGKNLFSICNGQAVPGLGALCYDKSGSARPPSGGWTIGALNLSLSQVAAPTNLAVTAQ